MTEDGLVALLESCGFDFDSTVRQLEARFPRRADWGVERFQIVPFELKQVFAGFEPAVWKIPFFTELDLDLPPQRYCYEYYPTRDARENHERSVGLLERVLGPGEAGIASNVYERHWPIGFYKVSTLTWPEELNRGRTNSFRGKNPHFGLSANITIEPRFPFVHPTDDYAIPYERLFTEGLNATSRVYARRNRMVCLETGVGVGGDSFFIKSAEATVRIPLREIEEVQLARKTPGRGGGGANLDLNTLFLGKHKVRVSVAEGFRTDSLDGVAGRVAAALGKRLQVSEYPDD